ncbi:hypothetical protein [Paraburkholderia sp. D1E]|uniref:hypothetical protein n=1 Tax=Paraburkholderia sp. D1E TaxID=3461398 RepID=UPI004045D04F
MGRILPIASACLMLYGCGTFRLQYQTPAPPGDFCAADHQASDHFECVASNESFVLGSPALTTTQVKPKTANDGCGNAPLAGAGGKPTLTKKENGSRSQACRRQ